MPSPSAIKAGEAFFELSLDNQQFADQLGVAKKIIDELRGAANRTTRQLSMMDRVMQRLSRTMAAVNRGIKSIVAGLRSVAKLGFEILGPALFFIGSAGTAVGAGLFAIIRPALKAYSELEDTQSRFNVAFGDSQDAMRAWATDFAKWSGFSQRAVEDLSSGMAILFDSLTEGAMGNELVQRLSKDLTKVATDLKSFSGRTIDEVRTALRAAFVGEAEPIRRLAGIDVRVAALNKELAKIGTTFKEANEQQKLFARFNLIVRGSAAAAGDLARTYDSLENAIARLGGAFEDLSAAIASAFSTEAVAVVKGLTGFMRGLQASLKDPAFKASVKRIASIAAAMGAAGIAALITAPLVTAAATALAGMATIIAGATAVLGGLVKGLFAIGRGFGSLLTTAVKGKAVLDAFADGVQSIAMKIEGFAAIWADATKTLGGWNTSLLGLIGMWGSFNIAIDFAEAKIRAIMGTIRVFGTLLSSGFTQALKDASVGMSAIIDAFALGDMDIAAQIFAMTWKLMLDDMVLSTQLAMMQMEGYFTNMLGHAGEMMKGLRDLWLAAGADLAGEMAAIHALLTTGSTEMMSQAYDAAVEEHHLGPAARARAETDRRIKEAMNAFAADPENKKLREDLQKEADRLKELRAMRPDERVKEIEFGGQAETAVRGFGGGTAFAALGSREFANTMTKALNNAQDPSLVELRRQTALLEDVVEAVDVPDTRFALDLQMVEF